MNPFTSLPRSGLKSAAVALKAVLSVVVLSGLVLPLFTYVYISSATSDFIFEAASDVPPVKTALVLGTSKYLRSGKPNDFFRYRMEAAHDLFAGKRIENILLSGDHRSNRYNEPLSMKVSLTEKGVPEDVLLLDPAGLRTFDSVIRAKEQFGTDSIVIVSQRFHLERALFIARAKGMKVCGFVANDPEDRYSNLSVNIREAYARVLTVLDLYLLGTEPQVKSPSARVSAL